MSHSEVIDYERVNKRLNQEARAIREAIPMRQDPGDLAAYIRCWSEEDTFEGETVQALVVILKTRGCTWALAGGCTMCGYANDSAWAKVSAAQLIEQFGRAWRKYDGEALVKIYTSGSFLDEDEVMPEAQQAILDHIGSEARVKKVAFESLPTLVRPGVFDALLGRVPRLEVGIGVESANDRVLRDSVNKGHGFHAFEEAAKVCRAAGVSVKAYLMAKPPYLVEGDALQDATRTIRAAGPHADIVSLNPTNVQANTVVDRLYKAGRYRPPWLWTLVTALRDGHGATKGLLKSDVIAAGQSRGAHNCGDCDEEVVGYLKAYKANQDKAILDRCLEQVQCKCRLEWRLTVELAGLVPAYADL